MPRSSAVPNEFTLVGCSAFQKERRESGKESVVYDRALGEGMRFAARFKAVALDVPVITKALVDKSSYVERVVELSGRVWSAVSVTR